MEQTNLLNEFDQMVYEPASIGQRVLNYVIDVVVFYIIVFLLLIPVNYVMVINIEHLLAVIYLLLFIVFFGYYTLMEGAKGKTVGKMITKTKVLTASGDPITYGQAFLRTLCRIVPFEFISVFLDSSMWHDKWVGTMVVKEK
jgi:uncharacterized RDD family membrane protein YckC